MNKKPNLARVREKANEEYTDISDHLVNIYKACLDFNDALFVELGTWAGNSQFALEMGARDTNSVLLSIDKDDCSNVSDWNDWHFVQSDDIDFIENFESFCEDKEFDPDIDLLFIDTSHIYEHTLEEIECYFIYLKDRCRVLFHDTHATGKYQYRDGHESDGHSSDGVPRALDEYFGEEFSWSNNFTVNTGEWKISNDPVCNGLGMLERGIE